MPWLTDLVSRLGTPGASANASGALAEARQAEVEVDRLLLRFDHPAGRGRTPIEPAAVVVA